MKIFFDSNVYVAQAIMGRVADRMLEATQRAKWRIYASDYLLHEVFEVLTDDFHFSQRLARLTIQQIRQVARLVKTTGKAVVPDDPEDSPILRAALTAGVDYLVTNDRHLLSLHPFQGLEIVSMTRFHDLLQSQGIL